MFYLLSTRITLHITFKKFSDNWTTINVAVAFKKTFKLEENF